MLPERPGVGRGSEQRWGVRGSAGLPGVRLALALLTAALPLGAEFLKVEVTFEDTGCASCIASLEGRLGRVRGVERVEIDAERGVATLHLAPNNRVRLTPLLSRITQDGTKILRTEVEANGTITTAEQDLVFQTSGLKQTYRLEFDKEASKTSFQAGSVYTVRGAVSAITPGSQAILTVDSITLENTGGP